MARTKGPNKRRRNPTPKGPVFLPCSVNRNTRAAPAAGARAPMVDVEEGYLLEEASSVGQPDPRTLVHDSRNLMEQIIVTIDERAQSGTLMDFGASVRLIHTLFEAAAAVATVAQMDDPDEQTEELDALYDHALAGMGLVDSKQQAGE